MFSHSKLIQKGKERSAVNFTISIITYTLLRDQPRYDVVYVPLRVATPGVMPM